MAGAYGKAGKHLALARRCVLDGRLTHPPDGKRRGVRGGRRRLSKKWLAPLFRGVHSSLAPTARPGSYVRKPLLRKAFCGFDAHVAKSDQSLRGLRPPNPRGFFDRLQGREPLAPALVRAARARRPPPLGWDEQLPPGKGRRGRAGDMGPCSSARPLGPWRRAPRGGGSPRPSGGGRRFRPA